MKHYEKPYIESTEMKPEEMCGKPSGKGNCAACQGASACAPSGLHGEGQ